MYDTYEIVGSGAGLAVSILGIDAGGVLSTVSAVAAAAHAVFFLGVLIARAVVAVKKWRAGKITDEEFLNTLDKITEDANDVTKRD